MIYKIPVLMIDYCSKPHIFAEKLDDKGTSKNTSVLLNVQNG